MDNPEPVTLKNVSMADDDDDDHYNQCTVQLQSGLQLGDLQGERGADFEIKAPLEDPDAGEYFDSEEIFKQLNKECLGDDEDNQDPSVTPFEKMAKKMEDITPEKSKNVLKSIVKQGSGALPVSGVTVTAHYNCYLEYSDEPYDSTRLRNRPEKHKLGQGSLLIGMELALSTMRRGEISRFLIYPEYAFGKQGVPPRIPPNATILMEIEVLNFTDRAELDEYNAMSEEDRRAVAFKKKLKVVNTERREGNELYNTGSYSKALSRYIRGLKILEGAHLKDQEEEDQMKHVQVKLCLNVALCALKLKQPARTISNCNKVIEVEPKNPKALFRKGQALMQLGEFSDAQRFMMQAQQQLPSDPSIARDLLELERHWKRFKSMERSMYGKMFPEWKKGSHQKGDVKSKTCVTEEFKAMVKEKLKMFQEMPSMVEMPLQSRSLTTAESSFMETAAKEMGMTVQRREYHGEQIMKLVKPPVKDSGQ